MSSFVSLDGLQHRRPEPLSATTKLVANGAVMLAGGELKPASGAALIAGTALFAGVTYTEQENRAAVAATVDLDVLVRTGFVWECETDPTDPPTSADLLKDVALSTATTVKKTVAVGALKMRLLRILPGNRCQVLVYP